LYKGFFNIENVVLTDFTKAKDGKMRTIAVINQKGGCGKTTISINLASALAVSGSKTLLVDMDPQSHCGVGLAVPEEQVEHSIYDLLISSSNGSPLALKDVVWEIGNNLDLAPASIDLAAFDQQMAGILDRENCLKNILDKAQGYDYVVIDCPPSVNLLTFNAMRAATDVIVPVETGYFSLHGLSRQLDTLNVLCKRCEQQINVKVLASMYDIRTKMGREILSELRKQFGDKMFKTVVNFNTKLKEAASLGQPISEYDPASKGFKDFQALVNELAGVDAAAQRKQMVAALTKELDNISSTANELLAAAGSPPAKVQKDTEAKIAEFYGVRQLSDAVAFVTLYPRASKVELAGDFNNWQPQNTALSKIGDNGAWEIKLPLKPGRYRYRLVVDGQWQQDPYNSATEMNPFGEYNSVLEVK
jgi:chromosome partitioning protein